LTKQDSLQKLINGWYLANNIAWQSLCRELCLRDGILRQCLDEKFQSRKLVAAHGKLGVFYVTTLISARIWGSQRKHFRRQC
jgi:hypothetical protein